MEAFQSDVPSLPWFFEFSQVCFFGLPAFLLWGEEFHGEKQEEYTSRSFRFIVSG
jgi:hypothetical protein